MHQVKQKAKEELEEYREDIKCERQRRVTDLQRQQEEHQELITALKNEYESNLQRIRELNSTEINMTKDAGEALRYVKIFLLQSIEIYSNNWYYDHFGGY